MKYIKNKNLNRNRRFKLNKFKKVKKEEEKDILILLSHNLCVDGLSTELANTTISNYVKVLKSYMDLENDITGYKILHYITLTSIEKRGITVLYPHMKEVMDMATTEEGYSTEKTIDRLKKIYDALNSI
jgi:hypothetical protein